MDRGAPTAPLRFISHSAVFPIHSLYSSSLPLSSAVPLLFRLHLSSTPSLPPSVTFHVVTHYSTDISPSVPLSLPPFLPYWCWPSPPCLGLDGTEGEKAGEDVPDGRTLNSKRERKDGGMKEETKTRRGEDLWVCTKRWKRADRKLTDRPSLPEMTDERTNRHMQTTHPHSPCVSLIGQTARQRVEDTALVKHSNEETHTLIDFSLCSRLPPFKFSTFVITVTHTQKFDQSSKI